MNQINTEILTPDRIGLDRACDIWRDGGLVAFPTETVYGLGADACNDLAVARIFEAKARPSFNPLIIHVADLETARRYARFNDMATRLAEAFWPGPMSLVLPVRADAGLSNLVTAGLNSVAIRLPENPLAQSLLKAFGGAIAAPSANPSGKLSPTTAAHVVAGLSGRIEAVVDGGACAVGLESTIVLPSLTPPALLRPGGLPIEALEAMTGAALRRPDDPLSPITPGQMASHYAPSLPVLLGQKMPPENALWIGFGPECAKATFNLSPAGDLREAAAALFGLLHEADQAARKNGCNALVVAPIPERGLGVAINDRLKRAAAPR